MKGYTGLNKSNTFSFDAARSRRVIAVLMLVYVVNYADRMIVGTVGEAMKRDLRLTDTQLGMLGGTSFTILYVCMSLPLGRLVEKHNRARIIWIAVAGWSMATVLCGFAQNFAELLLCRAAVGMGEGAFIPAVLSLLSDYFPPNRRASVYSTIVFGLPIGGIIGALLGGWLSGKYGWQSAFLAVGAPGILLAALVASTLREPPRGFSEPSMIPDPEAPSFATAIRTLVRKPAYLHLVSGAGLCQLVAYGMALFLFPFLTRNFGLSFAATGALVGLVNGVGTGIGIVAGGVLTDWLGRRDVRWYAWTPAGCLVAIIPLYLFALVQTDWKLAVVLFTIPSIVLSAFAPTLATVTQGMVTTRMRGTTAAISSAVGHVIALGFGATLTGFASDFFASRAYERTVGGLGAGYSHACSGEGTAMSATCLAASGAGLRDAMMVTSVFLLWGAIHLLLASRSLKSALVSDYRHRSSAPEPMVAQVAE